MYLRANLTKRVCAQAMQAIQDIVVYSYGALERKISTTSIALFNVGGQVLNNYRLNI
jgi:hypothetical protein